MLEKLALKHSLWVKYARQICKDNYLADDLVSEMYLKLMNTEKELNDWYVYFAIKHLHIDWLKKEKQYAEISPDYIANEEEKTISIELPNNISWVEKQILLLRQEMTCRQIEKQYHINYLKIHRIEKQAKEKIQEWAERKYRELVMQ